VTKIEPNLFSMFKVSQTLVQVPYLVYTIQVISALAIKARAVIFSFGAVLHIHRRHSQKQGRSVLATGPKPLVLLLQRVNACHDAWFLLLTLTLGLRYLDVLDGDCTITSDQCIP